jgi:transposase
LKGYKASDKMLVLIDLTGGYERLVVEKLSSKGYNVREQGRKVKQFMLSCGEKAKTDKIDARMLTIYGEKMQESVRL